MSERGGTRRVAARVLWAIAASLVLALLWITRMGTHWPSIYFMTGPSMEPTVAQEEYFLAWTPPGRLARGDLVIFLFRDTDGEFHVLRRIGAVAGDTVSMRAGAAIVNGVRQPWGYRIVEPAAWKSPLAVDLNLYDWGPVVVPRDSVFLLADTRDIIGWPDSRFLGAVPTSDILARATRAVTGRRLR